MVIFEKKFGTLSPGDEFGYPNPYFKAQSSPGGEGYYAYLDAKKLHPEAGVEFNAVVEGRLVTIPDDEMVLIRWG